MKTSRNDAPRSEAAPWREVVLVCGKCLRKADREAFRGELKRALKDAGVRGVRPVQTACLDLCPKGGIALARGADLANGSPRLHVIDAAAEAAVVVRWMSAG